MCTKNPLLVFISRIVMVCLLSLFLPGILPAQKIVSPSNSSPGRWQLDATVNGVKFYYYIESCQGRNMVFLKINNTNKYKVEVTWKEVFTTQFEQKAEGFKGQKKMVLPAGETSETNCTAPRQKKLLVSPEQVNPAYPAEISAFSFASITVSKVK